AAPEGAVRQPGRVSDRRIRGALQRGRARRRGETFVASSAAPRRNRRFNGAAPEGAVRRRFRGREGHEFAGFNGAAPEGAVRPRTRSPGRGACSSSFNGAAPEGAVRRTRAIADARLVVLGASTGPRPKAR